MSNPTPTEMIAALTAYKEKCVSQGKYLEAEKAKQKILKLKIEESKYREQELKQRQQKETEEVEQGHIQDFQEFNELWEKELNDFEDSCRKQIEELRLKHEQEFEETRQISLKEFDEKLKPNQKKNDLIKARDSAVKLEEYLKAHSISQQLAAIEKEDLQSYEMRKKKFLEKALAKVEDRQHVEMEGLKNRLRRTHEELKRKRGMEMERVIKRFQNNKKELERAQSMEISIANGKINTPAAWNFMESQSISRILMSSRAGTPGLMLKEKSVFKEEPGFDLDQLKDDGQDGNDKKGGNLLEPVEKTEEKPQESENPEEKPLEN
jgi:DNA repair exonuclease SbcCD ATPase subunit